MKLRLIKLKRTTKRLIYGSLLLVVSLVLSQSRERTLLETIVDNGEIKFITRQGPITYYEDAKGKTGFEYLLAKDFAEYLGVQLRVTTSESLAQLFNMLGGPNADFAGATLTITPERLKEYRFSKSYASVVQTVLYRRGQPKPKSIKDILGKPLAVVSDSSHEERLRELRTEYPDLSWQRIDGVEMVELMEMIDAGSLDYAVIDSTTFEAHRTIYPRAKAAFHITEGQELAWVFPGHGDTSLIAAANHFLQHEIKSGRLAELEKEFFSDIEHFSIAGSQLFQHRIRSRLPQYRQIFETTAKNLNIDWHLLAAIAYQESHWNPKAVSPTGVQGLMMLTKEAAREVDVKDRTNPKESIRGGGQYYLATKSRIPKKIGEPDRTWLALAAYNVGLGHLEDARVLTERAGKDPNQWDQIREHLPLLQRQKYYKTLRHGYARGQEPVHYVRNVRKYLRILQWNTIEENRRAKRGEKYRQPPTQNWDSDSFRTL